MKNENNANKIKLIILALLLLGAFLFIVFSTIKVAEAMDETYKEYAGVSTETETELTTETELETETTTEDYTEEITTTTEITLGVEEDKEYLYIFCEVIEINWETYTVLLPNGELHEFYMFQDPPIDDEGNPWFERVCFKVAKESKYDLTKWKLLAVQ